jgi:OPA family sugar phosphate sensor protein UhpC-like MFS transporter
LFSIFKPSPFIEPIEDPEKIKQDYRYWRLRICYSIFLGYAIFYFTRKSFTFAMPALIVELGYTKAQLGMVGSALYLSYGVSKFVSGVISDRSNPRYLMSIGLIITGILNIVFGYTTSIMSMAILWGMNGWFQAWGWPAATKLLTSWYAKSERGSWYSLCSTSHNAGGALIPLIVGWSAAYFGGWQWGLFVPGVISIVMGIVLMFLLRDVPETLGLPPIDEYKDHLKNQTKLVKPISCKQQILSVREILFNQVLNNKFVWILSIAYFFIYIVRTALNDWMPLFLMETRGYEQMAANAGVFWFEIGGVIGMLIAGWGSDFFFKSKRVPMMVICSIGMIASAWAIYFSPFSSLFLDYVYLGLAGMFVFGPQMLVGLAAAELVDKGAAAASNGFTGTLAYFGAAAAAFPLGWAIDEYDWGGFFSFLVVCSIAVFLLLLPLWKIGRSGASRRHTKSNSVATSQV